MSQSASQPKRSANARARMLLLALSLLLVPGLALADGQVDDAHADDTHAVEAADSHADDAHADDAHGEDTHAASGHGDVDGHGGGHGGGHGEHLELPHIIMVLRGWLGIIPHAREKAAVEEAGGYLSGDVGLGDIAKVFENTFFSLMAGLLLSFLAMRVYRNRQVLPGRLQALFEIILEMIEGLAVTMMGPKYGRHYAPFIATIFVYLLVMNYSGLVPLGKASTSTFLNNISIGICVFLYVQYTGIKRNGIGGYLHHLCGSPKDVVGWCMSPLLFALELFGEFVKPVSLSLRLFGNIFGEDMLLAVFALLGTVVMASVGVSQIGIPFHLPFLFLSLLLGLIQALVFSLLATVYISLMLPHGEHAEGH